MSEGDRITVAVLAREIAKHQASWKEVDDLRKELRTNFNQLGWEPSGLPSVLEHIAQMHDRREITARHIGNGMPPNETRMLIEHRDRYWLSADDVSKVKARLLPEKVGANQQAKSDVLSGEQLAEIVRRRKAGESAKELAKEFGKTASYIYRVAREAADGQSIPASDPFRRTRMRRN